MKKQFVYANILGRTVLCEVVPKAKPAKWKCDLGNGEFDHDWKEHHDSSGEVDGGPGDQWTHRECRVCGEIDNREHDA